MTYIGRDVDFFALLQQRVDDAYVPVPGRGMYASGAAFVRHVQINALFKQHHRTVCVAV